MTDPTTTIARLRKAIADNVPYGGSTADVLAVCEALEVRLKRELREEDSTHSDACWEWHPLCAERKIAALEKLVVWQADRIAAQAELLGKRAESPKKIPEPTEIEIEKANNCCARCFSGSGVNPMFRMMILCPKCGNKRCPKAQWHGFKCTGSNEPNQLCYAELGGES